MAKNKTKVEPHCHHCKSNTVCKINNVVNQTLTQDLMSPVATSISDGAVVKLAAQKAIAGCCNVYVEDPQFI